MAGRLSGAGGFQGLEGVGSGGQVGRALNRQVVYEAPAVEERGWLR